MNFMVYKPSNKAFTVIRIDSRQSQLPFGTKIILFLSKTKKITPERPVQKII